MNCAQTSHSTGQATQATRQANQVNQGLVKWRALDVMDRIIVCFFLFL
jgi:multisubunit Na+/H+ antiporter MnhB subunit